MCISRRRRSGGSDRPCAETSGTSGPPGRRFVTAEVDLERLAAAYHHRPPTRRALERARTAAQAAGLTAGDRALDVGGGPGHHAAEWARFGVRAVVVDPSRAMVAQAHSRQGVKAVAGVAQALPFHAGVFRLVYFHLSIHYGDWRASVAEARRVAAPGGTVFIWTMSRAHHLNSIYAEWFPQAISFDLERFPEPQDLADHMERSGLVHVSHGVAYEEKRRRVGDFVVKVRDRFISSLHALSDAELEAGLQRFGAEHPDPDETITSVLRFDWLGGHVP